MKIEMFYSNSADLEDLTQDKAVIEMNGQEFSELLATLKIASYENITLQKIMKKFDSANAKRKVTWID